MLNDQANNISFYHDRVNLLEMVKLFDILETVLNFARILTNRKICPMNTPLFQKVTHEDSLSCWGL